MKQLTKSKISTAVFSFLTGVRINLVGQLYGSELLAIATFPFYKVRRIFSKYPDMPKMLLYYSVLLFSLMFSDFYNGTQSTDYLRGWASVFFSFMSFLFLVINFDKAPKNIIYFLIFFSISKMLFGESVELQSFDQDNYFKAKIANFVNPLVIVLAYYLSTIKKPLFAIYLLLFYGLFNIVLDARSNSLAFFISFFLLFIKVKKVKLKKGNVIVLSVLSLITFYGLYAFYVSEVLSGAIGGINAQQITMAKNPYNPIELLYYGRAETFIAFDAIAEKPFFGHGSWAKDTTGKYNLILRNILNLNDSDSTLIPGHSVILTAWLWAGLTGFLAALWFYVLLIKRYFKIYKLDGDIAMLTIITPLFIDLVWNFIFSPFGHLRETIPQIAAIIIVYSYTVQQSAKKQFNT